MNQKHVQYELDAKAHVVGLLDRLQVAIKITLKLK